MMTDELRRIGENALVSRDEIICRQINDGQFLVCRDIETDYWRVGHLNMLELALKEDNISNPFPKRTYLFEADWGTHQFAAYDFDGEGDARRFFEARRLEMAIQYKGEPE